MRRRATSDTRPIRGRVVSVVLVAGDDVDATLDTAKNAAQRNEQQPNSRIQFDNAVSYSKSGWGGDHLFKGGAQFARLYFDDASQIYGNEYLNYQNNAPINVQEFNTPTEAINVVPTNAIALTNAFPLPA